MAPQLASQFQDSGAPPAGARETQIVVVEMLNSRLPKPANDAEHQGEPALPRHRLTGSRGLPRRRHHHHLLHHLLHLLASCSCSCLMLLLPLLALQCQSYQLQHEPVASNEISARQELTGGPPGGGRSREVTNLRLMPELRSVRLRWDYEARGEPAKANGGDWPASFRIRYCELTSWQAEIKCKHKDLHVERADGAPAAPAERREVSALEVGGTQLAPHDNSTVIFGRQHDEEFVRLVGRVSGSEPQQLRPQQLIEGQSEAVAQAVATNKSRTYEAQIYDLRAVTSYTFSVQAHRFAGEPVAGGARPARKLDLASGAQLSSISRGAGDEGTPTRVVSADKRPEAPLAESLRVETKPFGAEALKCLANSSEVLVNTGRYFGGRISVEGPLGASSPPACQLLGNKSSAQSAYLFRIDHELCQSRVLDSQRIETMVLVHENKDLLTHNTARFLVQCNVSQRSFTVRASVSLPKVDSLAPPPPPPHTTADASGPRFRPATITALSGPPAPPRAHTEPLRLGSMPGVFRLVRANRQQHQQPTEDQRWPSGAPAAALGSLDDGRRAGGRESKELVHERPAQALLAPPPPPPPVDVSSGVLVIGRAHQPREIDELAPSASSSSSRSQTRAHQAGAHSQPQRASGAKSLDVSPAGEPTQQQQQQQPIVLTNNHRVAGDFLPLAQAVANLERTRGSQASSGFSIKYSPESVGEYSLASSLGGDSNSPGAHGDAQNRDSQSGSSMANMSAPTNQPGARSRSGRMRQIEQRANASTQTSGSEHATRAQELESRMGEALSQGRAGSADSSVTHSPSVAETRAAPEAATTAASGALPDQTDAAPALQNPTLAQNITGALIRWSLKTLGNLARKSLDALASQAELAASNRTDSRAQPDDEQFVTEANQNSEQADAGGDRRHAGGAHTPAVPQLTAMAAPAAHTRTQVRVLDGFLVERSKPGGQLPASRPTATTMSSQQQSTRAATQSADLRDSARPRQLEPPLGQPAPQSTTNSPATSSILNSTPRPSRRRGEQRARLEQTNKLTSTVSLDSASLLPPGDEAARSSQGAASSSPSSSSSSPSALWPIYCLWSLAGLFGLLALGIVAFLLVSDHRRRKARVSRTTGGSQRRHNCTMANGGLFAHLNNAIRKRCHSAGVDANQPPHGSDLPPHPQGPCLVQSPSVHRRELTLGGKITSGRQFNNVSHITSPGGSSTTSAASTRSTSAASTANMSSGLGTQARGGGGGDSSSAGTSSPSHSSPSHENYCKNHEQFFHTDYLLLNDSDCLSNECAGGRGESFA